MENNVSTTLPHDWGFIYKGEFIPFTAIPEENLRMAISQLLETVDKCPIDTPISEISWHIENVRKAYTNR